MLMSILNPHFDENKGVWRDEYSADMPPADWYHEQFESDL
jgi:hypothetical protein